MSDPFLGHAVENGRVRFFSVSSLEKGDPRANGCPKRWAYRYVVGEREAESEKNKEAKDKGTALHGRIAHYLKTGEQVLEPLELRGAHFIPKPGSDLWIEQPFHKIDGSTITSSLSCAGVPLVGYIDCAHARGYVDPDGFPDPIGTIELIDWKRKGNAKDRDGNITYKLPGELVRTTQMSGYGMVVANTQPTATHVRLSHGYFFEKGESPKKVTKLHVLDDCRRTWEYVEGLGRTLVHVAAESDIERVPGNVRACDAYGGCPFREASPDGSRPACSTYQKNSLDVLYGKVAKEFNMPLLSQVTNAPLANAPLQQQLAQEEQQLRAQQQQAQLTTPNNLVDAWQRIQRHGRGTPALSGEAASALAAATGTQLGPNGSFTGQGQLGQIVLQAASHIMQLAAELDGQAQPAPTPAPAPAPYVPGALPAVSPLPPNAPPSMPALAQVHTPANTAAQTPQPLPAATPSEASTASAPPAGPSEAPAKKRGRPAKNDTPPAPDVAAQATSPTPAASAPQASAPQGPLSSAVFVDAIPNMPYTDLHAYIAGVNAELAKRYCVTPDGKPATQDIRCAPKNVEVLAFGAWKGALAEVVRSNPPAPGVYYIDTRTSELAQVVAEAMRDVCEKHGVLYVRGVR